MNEITESNKSQIEREFFDNLKFEFERINNQRRVESKPVLNVLDLMVPLEKRGAKKDPFVGGATGGGIAWTTFKYEKATFTFSFSFDVDAYLKSAKEFTFSETYLPLNEKQEIDTKPKDDFLFYRKQNFEVAAITWSDRECGVK